MYYFVVDEICFLSIRILLISASGKILGNGNVIVVCSVKNLPKDIDNSNFCVFDKILNEIVLGML